MIRSSRFALICMPLLALALLSGCAKKKVIAEAAPPPAPEAPAAPAPAPPPSASEEPVKTLQDKLTDVFYDYDSAQLSSAAQATLDADAKLLSDNANEQVTIEGHCDERGTVEYNLALGDRRAQSAKDYLVRFGISASRVQTISYGEERPFATGSDESAWSQNRRAHFVVR
ncbi:MAG: peptidoglycan-associated lipoprotein Pal [Candidatus Eisenbacteria bacterium]